MKSISRQRKADKDQASLVITNIFMGAPAGAMQSYLNFLHTSIKFLSSRYSDRWGITLYDSLVRLNAGMVEALVLHRDELRVLVDRELAPSEIDFPVNPYKTAKGCYLVRVPLATLSVLLPALTEAHNSAMGIAAKSKAKKTMREAHSAGVTHFLAETLGKPVINPSYYIEPIRQGGITTPKSVRILEEGSPKERDEDEGEYSIHEGLLRVFTFSRRERDHRVRPLALAKRGNICEICGFDFTAVYGDFAANCVEVHHVHALADTEDSGVFTSLDDVIIACPNCHRALHRYSNPKDWKGFKASCSLG